MNEFFNTWFESKYGTTYENRFEQLDDEDAIEFAEYYHECKQRGII